MASWRLTVFALDPTETFPKQRSLGKRGASERRKKWQAAEWLPFWLFLVWTPKKSPFLAPKKAKKVLRRPPGIQADRGFDWTRFEGVVKIGDSMVGIGTLEEAGPIAGYSDRLLPSKSSAKRNRPHG